MKLKFLPRISHPQVPHYQFIQGRASGLGTGAMIYGFNSWPLPLQDVIGPGTIAGALRVTQLPQLYLNQAVPIVGLGGLQAGQIVTAPLVNPDLSSIDESEAG